VACGGVAYRRRDRSPSHWAIRDFLFLLACLLFCCNGGFVALGF
jgi:hypothetical protein